MLRGALIGIGIVAMAASIWSMLWWPIVPPLFAVLVWSVLLVVGLAFEGHRYKQIEKTRPGPGFQPTDESFVDPETGELVRVFYNSGTGERRYVRQADLHG